MDKALIKFRFKIIAPAVITIVLYIIAFFLIIIPTLERNNIERKKEMIHELTSSVVSIVHEFYLQSLNDTSRTEELKKQALQTVEYIQYGAEDRGYFWVVDTGAVLLCHPHSASYVKKDPSTLKPEISNVLYNIVKTVRNKGEGYLKYSWQNVSFEDEVSPKMAFVKKYDNWQWIIGTGIYLDDVYEELYAIKKRLSLISGIIILIIMITISFILRQSIKLEREKHVYHQELMNTMKKFKTLFETANDSLIIIDENLAIVDCNKKTLDLRGLTKEQILGKSPLDFVYPIQSEGVNPQELANEMYKAAEEKKTVSVEWKIVGIDGEIRYSLATISKFEINNQLYFLLILRDITDRKHIERDLLYATIQTEEIERARFANELHDGVGPIFSTVKLYFQWLSENMNTAKRQEIIKLGNKNIEEAIKALRQVSYKLSPHILANFGIVTALNEFISNITKASSLHINFETNLKGRLINEVEITFYRVLTELINNTIKYAEAKNVKISILHNSENQQLKVNYSDDGKGFDIKEKFKENKGLGIINIQSRVKTLGGDIKYISSANKGVNVAIIIFLKELDGK